VSTRGSSAQTSLVRKVLLSIMMIGASGSTFGAGTFASYNATTRNNGTFDTGVLALSNAAQAGVTNSTCYSYGTVGNFTNGNSQTTGCDAMFGVTNLKPGDAATTVKLTLKNEGDTNASTLKVYGICNAATNNGSTTYHGTGSPCGVLALTIQETDSAFTTNTLCYYDDDNAGTACTANGTKTVSTFAAAYNAASNALTLSGGLASGASRYFKVSIQILTTASDQTVQGMAQTFGLTWMLEA